MLRQLKYDMLHWWTDWLLQPYKKVAIWISYNSKNVGACDANTNAHRCRSVASACSFYYKKVIEMPYALPGK